MNIAQNWRLNNQRYALKGVKCESCGNALFPTRTVCPHCQAKPPQLFNFTQPVTTAYEQPHELRQAAR